MAENAEDDVIVDGGDSVAVGDQPALDSASIRQLIAGSIRGDHENKDSQSNAEDSREDGPQPPQADVQFRPTAPQNTGRPGSASHIISVGSFEIDRSQHIEELSYGHVRTYGVVQKDESAPPQVAFVTNQDHAPNFPVLESLYRDPVRSLMAPEFHSTISIKGDTRDSLVVICKRPVGKPLSHPGVWEQFMGKPDAVARRIFQPIVRVLAALQTRELSHRRVNPHNIFVPSGNGPCVLGECWMAPAGIDNPPAYETYDCAMASIQGRGLGSVGNDLFSLAGVILFACTGRHPGGNIPEARLMEERIRDGSFKAMTKDIKIPTIFLEPIEGLLQDSPSLRWSMVNLLEWVQGRRAARSHVKTEVAGRARTIHFNGKDILSPQHLSYEMGDNWDKAAHFVCNRTIRSWARSLAQGETLGPHVDRALAPMPNGAQTASDPVLCTLLAALDPEAPIRYRSFSATISGIPNALYQSKRDPKEFELAKSALSTMAPRLALEMRSGPTRLDSDLCIRLTSEMSNASSTKSGGSYERMIYALNPGLHCLSPALGKKIVRNLPQILPALESQAEAHKVEGMFLDYELIAFIYAQDVSKGISRFLHNLSRAKPTFESSLGFFRFLRALQTLTSGQQSFPNLAKEVMSYAMPAIWQIRSRAQRKLDCAVIKRAAAEGRFDTMADLLMQRRNVPSDTLQFRRARTRYLKLVKQSALLRLSMANARSVTEEATGQFTMVFAAIISSLLFLFFFLGS